MKNIILVRHSKSDWAPEIKKDIDRTLSPKGLKDALIMAKRLKENKHFPELFISSTAKRAISTCEIFSNEFNYKHSAIQLEKLLYYGNTSDYLDVISKIDNKIISAIMFAHNPVISHLASVLLSQKNIEMPTCSIISINLSIDDWTNINNDLKHNLIYYDFPR